RPGAGFRTAGAAVLGRVGRRPAHRVAGRRPARGACLAGRDRLVDALRPWRPPRGQRRARALRRAGARLVCVHAAGRGPVRRTGAFGRRHRPGVEGSARRLGRQSVPGAAALDARPRPGRARPVGGGCRAVARGGARRRHVLAADPGLRRRARALVEYEEANSAYNALLSKATQQAFVLFEDRLTERAEPGRQVESARALFDLWIDAAEEAYAEVALSPEFRRAYGRLVDAQM